MARRDANFDAFDAPSRPHGWRASLGGGVPLVRPSTTACRVALFVGASMETIQPYIAFCGRVLQLLDDVDRAVPPTRKPADMLGECVLKHFEGHGTFMGTIVEYDQHIRNALMVRAAIDEKDRAYTRPEPSALSLGR